MNAVDLGLVPHLLDLSEIGVIADGAHRVEHDLSSDGTELLVERR